MGETIGYGGEGQHYIGYLEMPVRPNGAAVLIAHGAPGISDHERGVAAKLAGRGYVALAADYHGDGAVLHDEPLMQRMEALKAGPELFRSALGQALATLQAMPEVSADRIAAVGYCLGGYGVLELARGGAPLNAVVGYHSLLPEANPEEARNIRGKLLILNATLDPYASLQSRIAFEKAMNDAGVDWRMILFGGTEHGFTMPQASDFAMPYVSYNARSTERAWRAMLDFFSETIDIT